MFGLTKKGPTQPFDEAREVVLPRWSPAWIGRRDRRDPILTTGSSCGAGSRDAAAGWTARARGYGLGRSNPLALIRRPRTPTLRAGGAASSR
jgi:hypothetical protein